MIRRLYVWCSNSYRKLLNDWQIARRHGWAYVRYVNRSARFINDYEKHKAEQDRWWKRQYGFTQTQYLRSLAEGRNLIWEREK